MAQVITFERYKPVARYDDLAWTQARIEEAVDADGPWVTIDTLTLDPVDTDPENPATRNLTTEVASDTIGLWYRIVFEDASGDESLPTSPVQNTASASNLYISADELKASLTLLGTSFVDDDVYLAISSASRAIDGYKHTRFYSTVETRFYGADRYASEFTVDDLVTVTEVTVDVDGDNTYAETWVEGTDFYLDPANATTDGRPIRSLVLRSQAGRSFPRYARAVKIVGTFGWAETPALVKQAAKILATRLVARRDVPFGIMSAGSEVVAMARLGRIDPDVAWLLNQLPGSTQPGLRSLQLG